MQRRHVSTRTRWEQRVKYARVVRVGPFAWSAGTLGTNEFGDIAHPDSAYRQTIDAFAKIEAALREVGMDRRHVVRTRMYVIDMNDQEEVGRAHADFFGDIMPAATMLAIRGLASPTAKVEVELEAIAHDVPQPTDSPGTP